MRGLLFFLVVVLGYAIQAQTTGFIKAGQPLVVGKGVKISQKQVPYALTGLTRYRGSETVWLNGIQEEWLDSVLVMVVKDINPARLIFSGCNLTDLPELTATRLHSLEVREGNQVDMTSLCQAFRKTALKEMLVYTREITFDQDSLALLDSLTTVKLTNQLRSQTPTSTMTYYVSNNKKTRGINLVFYGSLKVEEDITPLRIAQQTLYKSEFDNVKQPVSSIRINDTVLCMESNKPFTFTYESGSRVSISPNTLMYPDGKAFDGVAIVSYREFRNEVDILLSGIPMTSTVNGEQKLFRSGGMYEISARDLNGRQLVARNDSAVSVNYATNDTASDFAIYQLNKQQWTVTNQPVRLTTRKIDTTTRAEREYYKFISTGYNFPDTTRFLDRFANRQYKYIYLRDTYLNNTLTKRDKKKRRGLIQIKNAGRMPDKRRLIQFDNSVFLNEWNNPYMQPFMKSYFVVEDGKSAVDIKALSRSRIWDVRVEERNGQLFFNFKTSSGFQRLVVTAVRVHKHGQKEEDAKKHDRLIKRYERILATTAKRYDKKPRYYQSDFTRYSRSNYNLLYPRNDTSYQRFAYNKAVPYMTVTERAMPHQAFCDSAIKKFRNNGVLDYDLMQLNNVLIKSGLGISNIDCYIHAKQMVPIYARINATEQDTNSSQATVMLFKNIKTSSQATTIKKNLYEGYRFHKGETYMVQFAEDRYMTVYKTNDKQSSRNNPQTFTKTAPIDVYNLSSDEVAKLIFSTE